MNSISPDDEETAAIAAEISALSQTHRELDDQIAQLDRELTKDELSIRRLKKQKLQLRDKILVLERLLEPDVPA